MFGLGRLQDLFKGDAESDQPPAAVDDDSNIPVLDEPIPELNEKIEINDNFSVSLDSEHSTETVEQQIARTHHEEKPDVPELVDSVQYTQTITLAECDLDDQQQDIEAEALKEKSDHLELVAITEEAEESSESEQTIETEVTEESEQADNDIEGIREQVVEKTWEKMEMLLMSHLPPQMSGSYLHILNSQLEENKQQILEDLSLLDKQSIAELLESLTAQDDKRN